MSDEASASDLEPDAVTLPYQPPLARRPLLRFLAAHAVPGAERHDVELGTHTRLVPVPGGPALVTVRIRPGDPATGTLDVVEAGIEVPDPADRPLVVARIRRWLDLDAEPPLIEHVLRRDATLRPLVEARPGLRVPGTVDGVETALLTVIGQQVSLAAARTFSARLISTFGIPGPGGLWQFPAVEVLAASGPEALQRAVGLTGARSRTVHGLATAIVDGLELEPEADLATTRQQLLALPGIGEWTADYIALRVLGDRDAIPAGDLVLQRVLGARSAAEVKRRAAAWSPWRGYALLHLWTGAVFA